LLQGGNLSLIGLLMPAPRKGSSGSNAQFAYPAQKHALGDIQITPRSVTTFAASILNARLNFRLVISSLRSKGHDLVFVSVKPPAADIFCVAVGVLGSAVIGSIPRPLRIFTGTAIVFL
jgi:hypothetical protein